MPGQIVEAVRGGRIVAVASWDLAEEITEVLRRPAIARYGVTEADVAALLLLLAPLLPRVDVQVPIRDPADAPVVAAALAGGAEAIVTGDRDFLDDETLLAWLAQHDVVVRTPAELMSAIE